MITETAGSIYDTQLREFIDDYQAHQVWKKQYEPTTRSDDSTAQVILFGLGFLAIVGTVGAILAAF